MHSDNTISLFLYRPPQNQPQPSNFASSSTPYSGISPRRVPDIHLCARACIRVIVWGSRACAEDLLKQMPVVLAGFSIFHMRNFDAQLRGLPTKIVSLIKCVASARPVFSQLFRDSEGALVQCLWVAAVGLGGGGRGALCSTIRRFIFVYLISSRYRVDFWKSADEPSEIYFLLFFEIFIKNSKFLERKWIYRFLWNSKKFLKHLMYVKLFVISISKSIIVRIYCKNRLLNLKQCDR